ncbi:MAG: TolC family protein, partial [Gemmatimonadales bacterium]
LIRERQDVRVEKLRLFQQLGIPAPTDPAVVVLTDSFPVVPLDWTLEQLLELTRDGNPSLASLRSSEDAARWQARAARSSYLPSISASVGWSGFTQSFVNASDLDAQIESQRRGADGARASCEFDNVLIGIVNQGGNNFPTNDCTSIVFTDADAALFRSQNSNFPFDFRNNPFSARLTVSLPIFSNFNRPLQVSQANAALDDAREAVRSLALRLEGDVSQAYYTMLTNFQTIEIQETNRIAAGEALQLATEQYRLGSGTFIQLLDAQVAAQQAESSYIRSLYDYHRSVAQLESAVGRRLR